MTKQPESRLFEILDTSAEPTSGPIDKKGAAWAFLCRVIRNINIGASVPGVFLCNYMLRARTARSFFTMTTESKEKHIVIVGMIVRIFVDWRKHADF